MASDARIAVGLPAHPKTKKLIRRIGEAGAWYLVRLFLWAASDRSNGDLSGLSDEDIELAVDWSGEDGAFVEALANVGFIDGEEGTRAIHDWEEHNPWAAGAEARSEKSKWAAMCKQYGREGAAKRMPEYAASIGFAPSAQAGEAPDSASGMPEAQPESATGTPVAVPNSASGTPVAESGSAPLPSFPFLTDTFPKDIEAKASLSAESPTDVEGKDSLPNGMPACPHQELIAMFGRVLPAHSQPIASLWGGAKARELTARWRWVLTAKKSKTGERYAVDKASALDFFERFFRFVGECPHLVGRNERGWMPGLEWLVKEGNFTKVLQGNYAPRKGESKMLENTAGEPWWKQAGFDAPGHAENNDCTQRNYQEFCNGQRIAAEGVLA